MASAGDNEDSLINPTAVHQTNRIVSHKLPSNTAYDYFMVVEIATTVTICHRVAVFTAQILICS